jgi:hypothetical protein
VVQRYSWCLDGLDRSISRCQRLHLQRLSEEHHSAQWSERCQTEVSFVKHIIDKRLYTNISYRAWAGPTAGYGYIDNITYENVHIENTDAPIVLDQCYFNINETTCAKYPSNVNITNIKFINFTGSSSGKDNRVVADLTCSPGATCSDILLEDINLTSPNGTAEIVCNNIQGGVGVPCISEADADN